MKPGPKPSSRKATRAAGLAMPDLPHFERDTPSPVMPDYLAGNPAMEPARVVWLENIERVVAHGGNEGDSDLFARYCCQEAGYRAIVALWMSGEANCDAPPTSMVESLRKMAELLGLAGPASRLRIGAKVQPRESSFARNGRYPGRTHAP